MTPHLILKRLASWRTARGSTAWKAAPRRSVLWDYRTRPSLEVLEDRCLLSAGALDLSLQNTGQQIIRFSDPSTSWYGDSASALAIQADGKIVVAGTESHVLVPPGQEPIHWYTFAVARLNPDGSLDATLGGDGKVATNINGQARAVALQADGKIVLAGGNPDFVFARFHPDGSLDATFGSGGVVTVAPEAPGPSRWSAARGVAVQTDGKILGVGEQTIGSNNSDFGFVRLNPNGTLDTTFGINNDGRAVLSFDVGTNFIDIPYAVGVQQDGRIVAAGQAGHLANFAALRLTANGLPDASFGTNGRSVVFFGGASAAYALALQPDGRIVLAGEANLTGHPDFGLVRLLADGAPDSSFGGDARVTIPFPADTSDYAQGVAMQPDGKLVVAGRTVQAGGEPVDFAAARLLPDGTLDPSFQSTGLQTVPVVVAGFRRALGWAVAVQPDGDIVLAGTAQVEADYRDAFAVVRLVGDPWVVVAADTGGPPIVKLLGPTGTLYRQFEAFDSAFTGGVRVAVADVTGDHYPDILAAPGPGLLPYVKLFEGRTLRLLRQIQVYGLPFTGGVHLAAGNVLGPDVSPPEIVVGPGPTGLPYINVLDSQTGALERSFLGFGETFTLGVRVSVGDTNRDFDLDIIASPEAGGLPYVNFFHGETTLRIDSYMVFDANFGGGIYTALGVVNSGPGAVLFAAPGEGGVPSVNVFDASISVYFLGRLQAYGDGFLGGVRVGAADYNADGYADVVVAPGPGGEPRVRIVNSLTGLELAAFAVFDPSVTGGLFLVGVPR